MKNTITLKVAVRRFNDRHGYGRQYLRAEIPHVALAAAGLEAGDEVCVEMRRKRRASVKRGAR